MRHVVEMSRFFCIVLKYSTGISKLMAPAPLSHYTFFFYIEYITIFKIAFGEKYTFILKKYRTR